MMDYFSKLKLIWLSIFITLSPFVNNTGAQTTSEIKQAKKLFTGAWRNIKSKRHLRLYYETDYFLVNDWTGNRQRVSVDAYKAFVKKDKLAIPIDAEFHAPYCEMQVKGKKLIYMTKIIDINGKTMIDKMFFVRERL